jgi:uncharacterized protein GlcG (DUF336 family)
VGAIQTLREPNPAGGLLIIVDGQVVGAIGVGGTRMPGGDEECAQAGIDAIMN